MARVLVKYEPSLWVYIYEPFPVVPSAGCHAGRLAGPRAATRPEQAAQAVRGVAPPLLRPHAQVSGRGCCVAHGHYIYMNVYICVCIYICMYMIRANERTCLSAANRVHIYIYINIYTCVGAYICILGARGGGRRDAASAARD